MRLTQRLTARHRALLVVDMQEKLLAVMPDREHVVANAVRLIRGATALNVPVWGTEQYPRGLGPTAAAIAELIPQCPTKMTFQSCAVPQILEQFYGRHIRHVTVVESRPTSAWRRPCSRSWTWGSGCRLPPTRWLRETRSTATSPCGASNRPER